jgi:CBS domain-containing protein
MNIADICTREVVLVDSGASLQKAATLMRERHVGALLVAVSANGVPQVAGIVTDRDIVVEAVARGLDPAATEIGPLASPALAAIPSAARLDQAISLMKERGVRRLLVSGDGSSLFGIVSLDDVLGALGHEVAELAGAVRKGADREAAERGPIAPPQQPPRPLHIPAYAFT